MFDPEISTNRSDTHPEYRIEPSVVTTINVRNFNFSFQALSATSLLSFIQCFVPMTRTYSPSLRVLRVLLAGFLPWSSTFFYHQSLKLRDDTILSFISSTRWIPDWLIDQLIDCLIDWHWTICPSAFWNLFIHLLTYCQCDSLKCYIQGDTLEQFAVYVLIWIAK